MTNSLTRESLGQHHQQVLNLLIENERLRQEVAHLQCQLNQLRQAGAALSPELAKSWLPGLQACDGWERLTLGQSRWDAAAGRVDGTGLRALVMDLRTVSASATDRIIWDAEERRRAANGSSPRPAPARVQPIQATSWLLNQRAPGLGDALDQLTKGLRGRLPLVIEAAFLLFGERAVAMFSTDPAQVVKTLLAEVERASEATRAATFEFLLGLIKGRAAEPQARQVLGVADDATAEEIKRAYRQLARQHHPDAGGDPDQFHRIQQAYELLIQPIPAGAPQ